MAFRSSIRARWSPRRKKSFRAGGWNWANAWRTRQFEYTWLRTLGGNYADFWQVTEKSLVFAARLLKIDLSADQRDQLMQSLSHAQGVARCCAGA